jgi:hypothetical protein
MAQRVRMAATVLALLVATPAASPALTPTPTPLGDLGFKQISGRVHDAAQSATSGIASARIDYRRLATLGGGMSGTVVADASGDFAFELFLHDSDTVIVTASAEGFTPMELRFFGYQLWFGPPLSIGLLPLSGTGRDLTGWSRSDCLRGRRRGDDQQFRPGRRRAADYH